EANESILQDCLDAYGHNVSRDVVRGQIDWLAEQNLVTVENLSGFYVVTITGRGQDVAEGRAKVSGVKRPRAR
ncbi:ArsR family transcriptional regulator, partial [Salmonella enterica subsp. diarizonae]|nr:ArsR family transcriptional regulator [Salmonella enterica subsp. diarizonae]